MKFFCLSSEYSRYLHSHLDTPLSEYSPDVDLDGRLRDLWVKGLPFNAKVGRVVNILWMVKNSKRILQLKFWLDLKLAKLVWMENLYCICIVVELQWTTWNTASDTVSNKLDFTESVFKRTKKLYCKITQTFAFRLLSIRGVLFVLLGECILRSFSNREVEEVSFGDLSPDAQVNSTLKAWEPRCCKHVAFREQVLYNTMETKGLFTTQNLVSFFLACWAWLKEKGELDKMEKCSRDIWGQDTCLNPQLYPNTVYLIIH